MARALIKITAETYLLLTCALAYGDDPLFLPRMLLWATVLDVDLEALECRNKGGRR